MSFWDKIQGHFTRNTYYSDNPKRERRLKELNNDCENYLVQNKLTAEKLNEEMKEINSILKKIYPNGKLPENIEITSFICDQMPFDEISEIFAPLLSIPVVSSSLLVAHVVLDAKDGSQLAVGLEAALGIPVMWLSGGMFFACNSVSWLAMGAIEDSVKRDELKKLIPKAVQSRKKIYRSLFYNKYLANRLCELHRTLRILLETGKFSKASLEWAMKNVVNVMKKYTETYGESLVDEELYRLDIFRNSWVNEDY